MTELVEQLGPWRNGAGPLHARLGAAVRDAIARGEIPVGTSLPPERAMAEAVGVSRGTVVSALRDLAAEGLLRRRQGSGSVVAARPAGSGPAIAAPHRRTRLGGLPTGVDYGVIDMSTAAPGGTDSIPPQVVAGAMDDLGAITAGTGYHYSRGLPGLRTAIARHMAGWGVPEDPENVLVATGCQQGISLVADSFVAPGDRVVVEAQTWAGAIDAFRAAGARVVGIPRDASGPRVERLREVLAAARPAFVYLCATAANPTGETMTRSRRALVVEACRDAGVPLVDDCTAHDLTVEPAPPALGAYGDGGQVITLGSTSKLFWAGVRIGWVHAGPALLARIAERKRVADLGSSLISQAVAARLLADHAPEMRRRRVAEIVARRDLARDLVARLLPGWGWTEPSGGFALWLRMPSGDGDDFTDVARAEGVTVLPGSFVSVDGGGRDHVRLALIHDEPTTVEAVTRLARAWRRYVALGDRRPERSERAVI